MYNSRSHRLLRAIMLSGGVLVISMIAPTGGAHIIREILAEYFRKKRFARELFLRDMKRLQARKLIDYRETDDGKVKLTLARQGKEKILSFKLENMRLARPARWDGQWRLILFDIPHAQRRARDAFRRKLQELKFYPIQKSVFITPYPCEDEIDFLVSIFNVEGCVLLFHLGRFEGEEKLRHHFRI